MTNTEELRRIIQESGFKYRHIAEKLGLTAYGLQKKIDNETEFKASEIDSLCSILGIMDKDPIFFCRTGE